MATADDALAEGTTRRKVPATQPTVQPVSQARVSPLAAEVNQQIRRPGGVSPAADAMNTQVRAARAPQSSPITQPAYRTGAPAGQPQFQQTPAPVNPNPRAASAALGAGAPVPSVAPRPAPVTHASAGEAAGRAVRSAARGAGTAARLGAAPVATTGRGVVPGLEKTAPGQRGGAGAVLGLTAGFSALGSLNRSSQEYRDRLMLDDPNTPLGAADQRINRGEQLLMDKLGIENPNLRALPATGRDVAVRTFGVANDLGASILDMGTGMVNAGREAFGAERIPTFAELNGIEAPRRAVPQPATASDALAPAAVTATPASATPRANFVDETSAAPPSGSAGDSKVVGTFNGRQITRSEANDLAASLNGGTGAGLENGNPTGVGTASAALASGTRAERGPISRAVGASIGGTSDLSGFAEQLDKQIADLGPLNMRSKRQLVGELLGLKGRALGQQAGDAAAAQRQAQQLEAGAASDALRAEVDREQIAATDRTQRRQNTQTITAEDGTIYSVDGTTLTPLKADGKPVRAPRTAAQNDNTQAKIAADLLGNFVPYGATPEQIQQGVIQANQAAAALTAGTAATPAAAAPQGYTLVGTSNGKPVYRDAAGKQFIDE